MRDVSRSRQRELSPISECDDDCTTTVLGNAIVSGVDDQTAECILSPSLAIDLSERFREILSGVRPSSNETRHILDEERLRLELPD
jgi:hypothetical protein